MVPHGGRAAASRCPCCNAGVEDSVWEPTIGNGRPHRTIIYLFWAAGGLLSIECLRFPRARGPARVAENSPQTHNRGAWVPCLCPWRRLGVSAAQGRRLNLFIYLINFMSVETTFNGPRTIRFEILIPTLPNSAHTNRNKIRRPRSTRETTPMSSEAHLP